MLDINLLAQNYEIDSEFVKAIVVCAIKITSDFISISCLIHSCMNILLVILFVKVTTSVSITGSFDSINIDHCRRVVKSLAKFEWTIIILISYQLQNISIRFSLIVWQYLKQNVSDNFDTRLLIQRKHLCPIEMGHGLKDDWTTFHLIGIHVEWKKYVLVWSYCRKLHN